MKKCGYVDHDDIEEALRKIDKMLENDSPEDRERVVVSGAGDSRVNGVYILAEDEEAIGLIDDEVMFLKEGDCSLGTGDYGLYLYGDSWGISNCADYFNTLYSCEISLRKGHTKRKPPKWGWKSTGGEEKFMPGKTF